MTSYVVICTAVCMDVKNYIIELRWDPILCEWVLVSNIRELRPWRPKNFCPFCPGSPDVGSGWDVITIENRYPALVPKPPNVNKGSYPFIKAKARGKCLVLVETPRHDIEDLCDLDFNTVVKVIKEIVRIVNEASSEGYTYVLWFRNKGKEVGVSLVHPHSQVYVLPFVPSKIVRELINSKRYFNLHKKCLFCEVMRRELEEGVRVVVRNDSFVAFVPFYAHWPFEVHIYPLRHVGRINELLSEEYELFAEVLIDVLRRLKYVLHRPMPYVLVLHQAPLKGSYPYYHMHVEIYGMYRVSGELKYTGGMELGGGNFTYDTTPEYVAKLLKEAIKG